MFRKDQWPFTPTCLSDIIDPETLAVLEAGCCERIGRAMTLIDYNADTQTLLRIDSINRWQHFTQFCRLLRDEKRVRGGNAACEACDMRQALYFAGRAEFSFHAYHCHMGLYDALQFITIRQRPIAALFAGQFSPHETPARIQERVNHLGTANSAPIQLLDATIRTELLAAINMLVAAPSNFRAALEQEAFHLQRIANTYYENQKKEWEREFLTRLRAKRKSGEGNDMQELRHQTTLLLEEVQNFCRCTYAIFYANLKEGDTVLIPIAQVGLAVTSDQLPHFNWKKAGIPLVSAEVNQEEVLNNVRTAKKGIRGDNSEWLYGASCIIPTTFGTHYRGALVLGAFAEPIDLVYEGALLAHITRIIGIFSLTALQILQLQQQKKLWEDTAKLLTHQVRTVLTPVAAYIDIAKRYLQKGMSDPVALKRADESLRRAHEMSLNLGHTAKATINLHTVLVEKDDLHIERFPLSVLVINCAEGFSARAVARQRELQINASIERLPFVEIDVARLSVAISNIIENAIKYSFPNTRITIRAITYDEEGLSLERAIIEIQDEGDNIPEAQRIRIFESGVRGLAEAKLQRIPGSGLGLWEARAVIEAHGGTVSVRCEPTGQRLRQGEVYRVTFRIKLPIRQPT